MYDFFLRLLFQVSTTNLLFALTLQLCFTSRDLLTFLPEYPFFFSNFGKCNSAMNLRLSIFLIIPLSREIFKWFSELGLNLEVIFWVFSSLRIIYFGVFSLSSFELQY